MFKRIATTVILSLLFYSVFSQVKFSIFAGPQITSARYTIEDVKQKTSFKPGFHLGAGVKVPFENKLYFSPSVFYNMNGYKVKFNAPSTPPGPQAINNNTTVHNFEMAFLLQYDFTENPGHYFVKLGPALDFALFGKEKFDYVSGGISGTTKRNMKFSFADYGHYLASLMVQFGYETENGIFVSAQYLHGLGSMNNFDGGPTIQNRGLSISVGTFLHKK